MSNVLIGIIGVILFIGLALASTLFLGNRFSEAGNDAEAARVMSEGGQINRAFELYQINERQMPDGSGETGELNERVIAQMVTEGYLKSAPIGAEGGKWHVSPQGGAVLASIGSGEESEAVCRSARRQAGMTGDPMQCADPAILARDPCCIG